MEQTKAAQPFIDEATVKAIRQDLDKFTNSEINLLKQSITRGLAASADFERNYNEKVERTSES